MSTPVYRAVLFDLLTALLDSWSLWNIAARSEEDGHAWRKRSLRLTFEAGRYRDYEGIIREAAESVGVPPERADELLRRWNETEPWPETPHVVRALTKTVSVGVATNSSIALAHVAVASIGVPIPVVVTAEEAGYYKPHPRPYRMALERLRWDAEHVLFVAGSAGDVLGASEAGMPVFWHNRMRLPSSDATPQPRYVSETLLPLLKIVSSPRGPEASPFRGPGA